MRYLKIFIVSLTVTCAVSCAPVMVAPSSINQKSTATPIAAIENKLILETPAREWWVALGDLQLNALVKEACEKNHDVRAAIAAVHGARALSDVAEREALPLGRLEAQTQTQRPSITQVNPYKQELPRPPSNRVVTIGQGLSWEIDLFGRIGTAAAVAERQLDVTKADLHAATALLQAEVVRHYIGLRQQQNKLALLKDESTLLSTRNQRLQSRFEASLIDRHEMLMAEADELQLKTEKAETESKLHTHLAILAVLSGRSPTDKDDWHFALLTPAQMPNLPALNELQHPTDLLARRPDVIRADARLRAAIGETVLAERAHLPRLSINLLVGLNAPFSNLGDAGAFRYAAGPLLQWDWLDGGRLKAREAAARAGQEVAFHNFEQTILKALQDSEVALRQYFAVHVALDMAKRSEDISKNSAEYAQSRSLAGLESTIAALDKALTHKRNVRTVLSTQADALLSYGQVQLALAAWQPDGN